MVWVVRAQRVSKTYLTVTRQEGGREGDEGKAGEGHRGFHCLVFVCIRWGGGEGEGCRED